MYTGINDFKLGYQPRTNILKDELVADSHSILPRQKNNFSQLLNTLGLNVRQTELHTAEPPVLEPSTFEVNLVIEKLKSHKSPGIDQIPAELRHRVEKFSVRSINLLFLFGIIRRNCLRSGRSQLLTYI